MPKEIAVANNLEIFVEDYGTKCNACEGRIEKGTPVVGGILGCCNHCWVPICFSCASAAALVEELENEKKT